MTPLITFLLMIKASLFSFSGTGNLPILRADLLPRGWATDTQFVESLAVGQVAPGPSGLWVISLGYLMDGLRGALVATLAICLPPLGVLPIARLYRNVQHHPAVEGFMRALSIAVVGIFVVVLLSILVRAGLDVRSVIVCGAAMALALTKRAPVVAIIAAGALIGWATG